MKIVVGEGRGGLTVAWIAKFAIHVALLFMGLVLAYEVRRALPIEWWLSEPDALRVFGWAGLYALIGGCVELIFQSERSSWRFASLRELVGLVRNVTITLTLFFCLIFLLDRGLLFPRLVLPLTWLLSLALLVGFRVAWRLPHDPALVTHLLPSWWPRATTSRMPLLIVGPMILVDRQLRMLQGDPDSPYQPVGVITPHAEEVGLRIHGVPFIGDLKSWLPKRSGLTETGATPHAILFLDDPVLAYGFSAERIGELRKADHILLKPQSLAEIDGSYADQNKLEEIPLEDFLRRQPISLDATPVRQLIAGRRVMVTGAGGSIGSEICRQLLVLGCSHLTMVDHSEFLLFEIDRELSGISGSSRTAVLANVRDSRRVTGVIAEERPDIIFHAAALKHVALVENNPAEGVLTNVLGTWNVIEAATLQNVDQFVLISTDKAVAPTNVMGATKRLAESLLELARPGRTKLAAVRFGNVLGSAGSVVPIFRDQIAKGGPVTVTHPDVNRFFMTIPEAVQLVLHSSAISMTDQETRPRKFLLEMGSAVKIVDLARQMIELSGKTPDVDVKIEFTGLKAGEKLSELLSDEDEHVRPCAEGIMEVGAHGLAGEVPYALIEGLVETARTRSDKEVTDMVFELLVRLCPSDSRAPYSERSDFDSAEPV